MNQIGYRYCLAIIFAQQISMFTGESLAAPPFLGPVLPQLNLEFSVAGVSITPSAGELDERVSEWPCGQWLTAA
jgi:hypothetical protein